jgi:hypothetical protein
MDTTPIGKIHVYGSLYWFEYIDLNVLNSVKRYTTMATSRRSEPALEGMTNIKTLGCTFDLPTA